MQNGIYASFPPISSYSSLDLSVPSGSSKHTGVCKPHSGVLAGALEVFKLLQEVEFVPGLGRNGLPSVQIQQRQSLCWVQGDGLWRNKPGNVPISFLWATACVFYCDVIGI